MKARVFMSSTFVDLVEHRKAVFAAAESCSAKVHGMELFGARPGAPRSECLAEVAQAHVFILVLGMRYGSTEESSGLSFTHLEYLEAQRLSIPCLVYLMDEQQHPVLPMNVDVGEAGVKLRDFKQSVRRAHTVSFFTSPEDLYTKCMGDLADILMEERFGEDSKELVRLVAELPKVTWLNDARFEFLRSELGELAKPFKNSEVLREVLRFLLAGDRQTAVFIAGKRTELDIRQSIDCCRQIDDKLQEVVRRGSSRETHSIEGQK